MNDLIWLVSNGYEVSIEADNRRTGIVSVGDVAVRLDRAYAINYERVETFWSEEHGIEGALKKAREWVEINYPDGD